MGANVAVLCNAPEEGAGARERITECNDEVIPGRVQVTLVDFTSGRSLALGISR